MSDDLPDDSERRDRPSEGKPQNAEAPNLNETLIRLERGLKFVPAFQVAIAALQLIIAAIALFTAIASWRVTKANSEMVRQSNTQRPYVGMETARLIEPTSNSFQAGYS
jgi:hypothetical protein